MRIERGRLSGSSLAISLWETTAWITPEMKKPRISGHRISQPMDKAMVSACSRAWRTDMEHVPERAFASIPL